MRISGDEIQAGRLSAESLALVAGQLKDVGYIILEQIIDQDTINRVYEAYLPIYKDHLEEPEVCRRLESGAPYVRRPMPLAPPFNDEIICANPIAMQAIGEIMGDFICTLFYHFTLMPGSSPQLCHVDTTEDLFPGLPVALPTYSLSVNIPLVDFTEENGSTEVWPGTHLQPLSGNLGERCRALPSARTNVRAGDLIIRDLRLWHRGMSNQTAMIRPMLYLLYCRPWYRFPTQPITLTPGWEDSLSERARRIFTPKVHMTGYYR
jgi:ectoine hydroxylase-related dioxygenase (phytanoyl-CoA dioxygenase family)